MNEDKIFNMLEKIYVEVQDTKSELKNQGKRLDSLETEVKKVGVTIDNDIKPKIEALFDGYKQNSEDINIVKSDVKNIAKRVNAVALESLDIKYEVNELKLKVVEGGKQ